MVFHAAGDNRSPLSPLSWSDSSARRAFSGFARQRNGVTLHFGGGLPASCS